VSAPTFQLRVHKYEEDRDGGTRTLIEYTPFHRLGAPASSGHSGEVVYLQRGYVYGEGGDVYEVADLPAWFATALAAATEQARRDVGFTVDRVQWYTGAGAARDVGSPNGSGVADPPVALPSSPTWKLSWLCKQGHDYQGTGMSRYGKDMRCLECKHGAPKATPALRTRHRPKRPKAPTLLRENDG
jgi:hypothetical protein